MLASCADWNDPAGKNYVGMKGKTVRPRYLLLTSVTADQFGSPYTRLVYEIQNHDYGLTSCPLIALITVIFTSFLSSSFKTTRSPLLSNGFKNSASCQASCSASSQLNTLYSPGVIPRKSKCPY